MGEDRGVEYSTVRTIDVPKQAPVSLIDGIWGFDDKGDIWGPPVRLMVMTGIDFE